MEQTMFEQSLVDISSETKRRKRWTALVSYAVEVTAVVLLASFPLVHTEALPLDDHPKIFPPVYHVPDNVQVVTEHTPAAPTQNQRIAINPLLPPREIPHGIDRRPDPPQQAGPAEAPCVGCIPVTGAPGDNRNNRVLESVLRSGPLPPVHHPPAPVPRSSVLQQGLLVRQVKPVYPAIAMQTRTQGAVQLRALIGRDGSIQQLQVIRGHPLLVRAALEAVQQWRYRPYILNGEPVEVETQITVNFMLNGN
jgi:periplasmic protein TonB